MTKRLIGIYQQPTSTTNIQNSQLKEPFLIYISFVIVVDDVVLSQNEMENGNGTRPLSSFFLFLRCFDIPPRPKPGMHTIKRF